MRTEEDETVTLCKDSEMSSFLFCIRVIATERELKQNARCSICVTGVTSGFSMLIMKPNFVNKPYVSVLQEELRSKVFPTGNK